MPSIQHQSFKGQTVVISNYVAQFDENGVADVPKRIHALVVGKYGYENSEEASEIEGNEDTEANEGQDTSEDLETPKKKPVKRKPAGGK